MSSEQRCVLGIDPGSARTGYGVVHLVHDDLTVVAFGCIETSPSDSQAERLRLLHADLAALMDSVRPDAVAIEELFFARNARTVIGVAQARGVALLAAAQHGVPVAEYTPLQVKRAVTGYGQADKHQVIQMVTAMLRLAEPPTPDDAADALAIAICHSRNLASAVWSEHLVDAPSPRYSKSVGR